MAELDHTQREASVPGLLHRGGRCREGAHSLPKISRLNPSTDEINLDLRVHKEATVRQQTGTLTHWLEERKAHKKV